jgi:outer membrane biosynthesis protein TonB
MLTSKPFVLAGCVAAVVGGTAFGWMIAGKASQSRLPESMVNSYTTTIRPAAVEKPVTPAVVIAPKVEEPPPVKAPEAADAPVEKKAKPEPKKRKAAAAEPGETPRKARPAPTEIDRGAVESFARRYGITLD